MKKNINMLKGSFTAMTYVVATATNVAELVRIILIARASDN